MQEVNNWEIVKSGLLVAGLAGAGMFFPAVVGAALVGGVAYASITGIPDSMQYNLEKAFEFCRLGVLKKNGKPLFPKLVKVVKRPYGWRFIYTIPIGLSIIDFLKAQMALQTATNSEMELWEEDGYLHIKLLAHRLPKKKWFEPFDIPEGMVIPIPIGYSRAGLEIADLSGMPHLLVGGTTGAGKSVFLHGLTYTLCHYQHVDTYVIDLKRLEFIQYKDHVTLATTLKEAYMIVSHIRKEMYRRMEMLKNMGINNVLKCKNKLPFIVLVVDEFAQLWPQKQAESKAVYDIKKKCHNYLHDILSLARAVGIHCVICTQRPDRFILPGQLKGNLPATMAFRTRNMDNAKILDSPMSALIPSEIKGRAIWNYGVEREVQVMMFEPEKAKFPPKRILPEVREQVVDMSGSA